MPDVFLDTNVLLRHFLADHTDQSPRSSAFLARIERGEIRARIAETVIFEAVFTLERVYRQPKDLIREAFIAILDLPGIVLPGKRRFRRCFDIYVEHGVSFADAYHATLVETLGLDSIISFDRGFDRIPTIRRSEP